jgi:hypothetical protein
LTERDFTELTAAVTRDGFGGPTSYYLNHDVNARYAGAAPGGYVLRVPVLFVGAAYDQVADLDSPTMLDAMRSTCPNLTEAVVPAGHWLQMEAAPAVNEHIESWLTSHVAERLPCLCLMTSPAQQADALTRPHIHPAASECSAADHDHCVATGRVRHVGPVPVDRPGDPPAVRGRANRHIRGQRDWTGDPPSAEPVQDQVAAVLADQVAVAE